MSDYRVIAYAGGAAGSVGAVDPDYKRAQQQLATRVLDRLVDKDVLHGARSAEDEEYTRRSADAIRDFVVLSMYAASGGPLYTSLRRMAEASKAYVRVAGPDARNFLNEPSLYTASLDSYREAMGAEIGWLAYHFELPLPGHVVRIIPNLGLQVEPVQ